MSEVHAPAVPACDGPGGLGGWLLLRLVGLLVMLFTIVITGIYVRRANREYDALAARIAQGALK